MTEQLEKILIQTRPGQKQRSQAIKISVYKIIYSDLHWDTPRLLQRLLSLTWKNWFYSLMKREFESSSVV